MLIINRWCEWKQWDCQFWSDAGEPIQQPTLTRNQAKAAEGLLGVQLSTV
jgi:hypothetical protein